MAAAMADTNQPVRIAIGLVGLKRLLHGHYTGISRLMTRSNWYDVLQRSILLTSAIRKFIPLIPKIHTSNSENSYL